MPSASKRREIQARNRALNKSGDNFTKILVISMVVLVVAVGVIFSVLGNRTSSSVSAPSSVSKADGYGIVFNGSTKNLPTVDVWEDFQCPYCKLFESTNGATLVKLISEKKAKVVFHTLTFLGRGASPSSNESIIAANAAACASDEGKFLAMHTALYENQPATENSGAWSNAVMLGIGAKIGLTSNTFADCISTGKYVAWTSQIENDALTGLNGKPVQGTPTIEVNGRALVQKFDAKTNKVTYDEYMSPPAFANSLKKYGKISL